MITKVLICLFALLSGCCFAQPSVEIYGSDVNIDHVALSPSGNRIAYVTWINGRRIIQIVSTQDWARLEAFDATSDKLRGLAFLSDRYLIAYRSAMTTFEGYIGQYEYNAAFALDIEQGESTQLLRRGKSVLWPQLDLDRVQGISPDGNHVLMLANAGRSEKYNTTASLFSVDLQTGIAELLERGVPSSIDIFVDDKSNAWIREDYSNEENLHRVLVRDAEGQWLPIFEQETDLVDINFLGIAPGTQELVAIDEFDNGYSAVFHMSTEDGGIAGPVFSKDGSDIDALLGTWRRRMIGAKYSGTRPSYDFYDAELSIDMQNLVERFSASSVHLVDFSEDLSKLLVLVEGNQTSGAYLLIERDSGSIANLGEKFPEISAKEIGQVSARVLTARDGLRIPTLITTPPGISDPVNLPAILMPHGGPEAYDQLGFDYMAQLFASRGYLVIQPNFRGSEGYGSAHLLAGRGEWGKAMQNDLTDAVLALTEEGVIDPSRVCILGSSYGGYAALAGGAFTPELYQCVVAIAPVTDIPRMLVEGERNAGKEHWVVSYWAKLLGDRKEDSEALKSISPINYAEYFSAPVLLIHGDDDEVVPINHSQRMESALKRAKKTVEFVRLKDEDHHLSNQETRIEALRAMSEFVDNHLR